MDILAQLMDSVGMNPLVSAQNNLQGEWGIRFPGTSCAGFHVVQRGNCFLRLPRSGAVTRVEKDDMIFVAPEVEHILSSEEGNPARPLSEFLVDKENDALKSSKSDGQITTLLCGAYNFDVKPVHPFFTQLPEIIHFPSNDVSAQHPMHSVLRLLSAELERPGEQPGDSVIIKRLIDVMFCYILRQWMETHPKQGESWIHAFYDDYLRRPIVAIHEDPAHDWSVDELASRASLSRAAFSQRFKNFVNDTPINYLAKVRVQKAMMLLHQTEQSIEAIASQVGYSTGFALSKAFKRINGVSPKQFRTSGEV